MKLTKTHFLLLLIILLHLSFIYFSANQPYYGDETFFIVAAEEITEGQITGHFSHIDGKLIEDKSNMLMHPPTYIYLLSLSIFIFGKNPYAVRAVSSLFAVGVIILIYLITKKLLDNKKVENSNKIALLASFLYAISPIAIQNSILVDIDGGLLNFFILLFIYLYLQEKSFYYLVPALFMVFASKIIGAIVLFATLFTLNLILLNYKEIFRTIKLFLISGASFFIIFSTYTKIFDLNWQELFKYNSIIGVLTSLIQNPYPTLARSLWGFKIFFYFATPFLIFLFILVIIKIIKNISIHKYEYIKQNKHLFLLLFLIFFNLAVILIAGSSGWNFSKYHINTIPSIIILIVYFTPRNITNLKKALPLIFITILLLTAYFYFILKDPLIPEVSGRLSTTSLREVAKPVLIRAFLYSIIPIFLCLGLFERIPQRKLWLVLLFLLIFTSFYIDIIQANADYSTHNLYGDKGLEQVIDYMKEKNISSSQIICYVHLGYYLDPINTYELTTLYYVPDKLREIIETKNIQYIILYQKDIDLLEPQNILNDFELDKEIGDYKVLKRK